MRNRWMLLWVVWPALMAGAQMAGAQMAGAQMVAAQMVAAQAVGAQSESLVIGPGDLLHVSTFDTPEFDQHPRVADDGGAPILFLGKVPLAGKTVQEAGGAIAELLVQKQIMRHPQVIVTIEQYATQDVSISGEVSRPGNYAIQTPRRVLEVLSLAGGLTQVANRQIVIQHRDGSAGKETYFVSNDAGRALGEQVWIRPGDTIFVAKVGLVYVLGDVARPGGYPIATNSGRETLLEVIAMAGAANKTAVLSGVRLLHKTGTAYAEVTVNLDKVQKGKAEDLALMADDVIVVPFSYGKNFVLNGTGIAASIASAALYVY